MHDVYVAEQGLITVAVWKQYETQLVNLLHKMCNDFDTAKN